MLLTKFPSRHFKLGGKTFFLKSLPDVVHRSAKLGTPRLLMTTGSETDLNLGTEPKFIRSDGKKIFSSEKTAVRFVQWLLPEERSTLLTALTDHQYENEDGQDSFHPTLKQLKLVLISNAIPFVGFGFLDNAIMITAGEYIDHTIGLALGITTMAAAAVGNLISDLMGLGLAGYVEAIAIKLGFDVPPMSTRQAAMWKTKYSAYFGRGIGITIGCIIGMFPLLIIDFSDEADAKETEPQKVAEAGN